MSDTVDRSTPLDAWTARLAAPVGDPGGGAAGAVALALGAGLLSMVAGYTVGSPAAEALRGRADALRERALRLADDDAAASAGFGPAFAQPEGEAQDAAVIEAARAAAASAAALARAALEAVDEVVLLDEIGAPMLAADVAVAASMVRAALVAARANVGVDLDLQLRHGGADDAALRALLARCEAGIARVDAVSAGLDPRILPG